MATDDHGFESIADDDVSDSPQQAPGESRSVHADVTYAQADARDIMLMTLPPLVAWLGVAGMALSLLLIALTLAIGESFPWPALGFFGLVALYLLLYLVLLPWRIAHASAPGQSWVVSGQGVRITLPGTDVKHGWSSVNEVVLRPGVVQFRIGQGNLSLPRRCVTSHQDLETLTALAFEGGVGVRKSGRLR